MGWEALPLSLSMPDIPAAWPGPGRGETGGGRAGTEGPGGWPGGQGGPGPACSQPPSQVDPASLQGSERAERRHRVGQLLTSLGRAPNGRCGLQRPGQRGVNTQAGAGRSVLGDGRAGGPGLLAARGRCPPWALPMWSSRCHVRSVNLGTPGTPGACTLGVGSVCWVLPRLAGPVCVRVQRVEAR